jgi:hypothetical protein
LIPNPFMQRSAEEEHQLRLIRIIPAATALVAGLFSLLAAAVLVGGHFQHRLYFLGGWHAVFLLALFFHVIYTLRAVVKKGGPFFFRARAAFLLMVLPPMVAGGFFSCWIGFSIFFIPGFLVVVWSVFYGLILLAGILFAPRSVIWLGLAFLVFGMIYGCLGFGGRLVFLRANEAMALSFGLFHLVYAVAVWPRRTPTLPPPPAGTSLTISPGSS